jgi:broad specificity phosphatase PhoE
MRRKPGAHLSQDGIELARLVGETSGPFSLVVTSPIPRAIETAIAMGQNKKKESNSNKNKYIE